MAKSKRDAAGCSPYATGQIHEQRMARIYLDALVNKLLLQTKRRNTVPEK